jgi:hypothetical protein
MQTGPKLVSKPFGRTFIRQLQMSKRPNAAPLNVTTASGRWLARCSNAIVLFHVPQVLVRSASSSSSSSSSSIQSMSSDDHNQKTVPEKKFKIYTGDGSNCKSKAESFSLVL